MELRGIAAASGYAMGPAFLLQETEAEIVRRELSPEEAEMEVKRFEAEVNQSIAELEELKVQTEEKMGEEHANIFGTHILVLQDEEYIGRVKEMIQSNRINAEAALEDATQEIVTLFESMDNEYLRERAADIRDVSKRIMNHLLGLEAGGLSQVKDSVVLLAHDLTPSDTAQLDRDKIAGFATNIGGRTSHSAIMARSMEIPAVVGLNDVTAKVKSGDYVILDGAKGILLINPEESVIASYKELQQKYEARLQELKKFHDKPSVTADGHLLEIVSNIGNPQDAHAAERSGAEGIGLYRSEFLYMGRQSLPSEEEQFDSYKVVAEIFGSKAPVVIRTLDIGGDKELPYMDLPKEANPFLGYRAIRLCLDRKDIFKTQLRAILRASSFGNIKLMYPMIATMQELREANAILAEVKQELDKENIPYNREMEVGMMIEVPAAALVADQLAREVDFFSIGTNDLVQYTMAADRMNERVSYLTEPFNPAVLRLIRNVINAAHQQGKWAGMCGEMAGNLTAIPLLVGLGLDEFSMSAGSILSARALMSRLNRPEMQKLAEEALNMTSAEEIKQYVESKVPAVAELTL
ncbi:phosphoenolpyruvate-protein phosphotransferase PtsI [Paenibacillus larvae subsp. larvae]|uniref:Phosphoenolpyruvate-protein phosphotransferase n=1 Tax=Paenibacillus larvae subsp. larvae TaxID=147375 RepID=A0A2L1U8Y9_9BACL|nr:phosphoenolpyruvate--protein phosphotransferase [Paenibacillus larvae]AQT86839.1 phosphoenolpyruvate--protein phosphotransferase [Paenibacillus larvae subsp. pulvifaciens]AQZ49115.1 phosphoenolpyruvate--protein phosphotransferase [Paenibacillus larvae subsp. pulvifaciens]AVF24632.1 phosphoenolpyruvate-protein phosphotransferase PtsI [Paenibacillus larvae subsp. larvae]AVF29393.1 phosphoenolpyruvate-protein phosphotransferase PtsI [Paenibacillus larvae subsp. larvae]MBH0343197.1 phosphoenolp